MTDICSFSHFFNNACEETLTERPRDMVGLRFGTKDGFPLTLNAIGTLYGVSRERVSQIVDRALVRIRARGSRQIKRGEIHGPCARLIMYLDESIVPRRDGVYERIRQFISREFPSLFFSTALFNLIGFLLHLNHPTVHASECPAPA